MSPPNQEHFQKLWDGVDRRRRLPQSNNSILAWSKTLVPPVVALIVGLLGGWGTSMMAQDAKLENRVMKIETDIRSKLEDIAKHSAEDDRRFALIEQQQGIFQQQLNQLGVILNRLDDIVRPPLRRKMDALPAPWRFQESSTMIQTGGP